jgi:hypothetical protein
MVLNGLIQKGVPNDWATHMIGHELNVWNWPCENISYYRSKFIQSDVWDQESKLKHNMENASST